MLPIFHYFQNNNVIKICFFLEIQFLFPAAQCEERSMCFWPAHVLLAYFFNKWFSKQAFFFPYGAGHRL